tara:strand:- start:3490 stop:4704 length:1215 start_codon:yes stop_codon:yes gene_type:complete
MKDTKQEWTGITFDKGSILKTVAELKRQQESKFDLIVPAKRILYCDDGRLAVDAGPKSFTVGEFTYFDWAQAEAASDEIKEAGGNGEIKVADSEPVIELNRTAASQLRTRLGIPAKFEDALLKANHNEIAGGLHRDLLAKDNRSFLLRCLDGRVRAVLSDRYRILDNHDLFFCAADKFGDVAAEIWKARVWDNGFELFATNDIEGKVRTDRPFDAGAGWRAKWSGSEGDVHNAAVRVSNSETGGGGLNVRLCILRNACANFCVLSDGVSIIHAGSLSESDDDGLIRSTERRQKESEVIWLKVKDAIATAFDAEKFQAHIDRLNDATQVVLENPTEAVDNVVEAYSLSDDTRDAILANLVGSGDTSQYGLVQAVTGVAHGLDAAHRTEAASELETIGAKILEVAS